METSVHKPYHDLVRKWHKKTIRSLPRSVARSQSNRSFSASSSSSKGLDAFDGVTPAEIPFPPFMDPTEEQQCCLDPIRALNIPRARYRTLRELTLCRKGITQLHPNIQYLENLETLILQHNRLGQITNLVPPRKTGMERAEGNSARGCLLLRRLFASHNCIQSLEGDVCKLRHLEVLLLAHNSLSNLRTVSAQLKPLRWLRELDLRGNPLCDEVGYRLYLIHEHPQLEVLDRRQVHPHERSAAVAHFTAHSPSPSASAAPVVAFLTTRRAPNAGTPPEASRRALFAPSPCADLLRARVQRDAAVSAARSARAAQTAAAAETALRSAHDALQWTFALSRRGLPLSAERWEAARRAAENPPAERERERDAAPRASTGRRSLSRPAGEGGAAPHPRDARRPSREALAVPLPPIGAGAGGHSVLYDALLGRTEDVRGRVGANAHAVPAAARLHRMRLLLAGAAEGMAGITGVGGINWPRLRDVQREKDALVPEPWEHAPPPPGPAAPPVGEQWAYTYTAAAALLLPAELSALEGQFMAPPAAAPEPGDSAPRGKRGGKRDRRAPPADPPTARAAAGGAVSPAVVSAQLLQQLPPALAAVGVEVGPPERHAVVRVMNMLEEESGAWGLCGQKMAEAFREEVLRQTAADTQTAAGEGRTTNAADTQTAQTQPQIQTDGQTQMSPSPPTTRSGGGKSNARRAKANRADRRAGSKSAHPQGETHSTGSSHSAPLAAQRLPPLTLSHMLLGLARYVPFVESRLAFFRARSVATGVKGESGAAGEAAREWFAKAQFAAAHCDRLREAQQMVPLTSEETEVRLIPLQYLLVQPSREVGRLFRERAEEKRVTQR